ncbi:hypothetical protein FC83_GL000943 [Agrilactobacillus composti DSM 18527 = JCM 14202]|uniref:IrrE N-terminal-like domain-containing protein n=1 Tax=Agrilactobacillus composti DSM 18527 = JCM 14202 TaxID=1423734 RepID=A0A0R1Y7R8_9LACO|nr:hypothetical protein [Agrilactobacillus composti]KRM35638.1 hypothetical protein FC83_GL000943 [Agrilactobacillus composti DSM 18527 = JCM 14202]
MNDLINDLLNYAFDHGINFMLTRELKSKTPSLADHEQNMIIINMNWYRQAELPRVISHEIGHMRNKDEGVLYFASPTSHIKIEVAADVRGLEILLPMYYNRYYECPDMDNIDFNTVVEQLAIPERLWKYVIEVTRNYLGE